MGRIIINKDRCKACYLCMDACPKNCIEKDNTLNARGFYPVTFNGTKGCTGCATCAKTCPDLAIEKVYR